MKRYMKKIATGLLAVTIFSALAGYAAASTADINFSQYCGSSSFTKLSDVGLKEDKTPLYLYITSSPVSQHRVCALGCATNSTSQTENLTQMCNGVDTDYVTCYRGTKYSIHSTIKEEGYGYATLSIAPMGVSGTVGGKWSPDSKGDYTHAKDVYT